MAIYHLSVKTISRSSGRSATAAVAYRSGERIVDVRSGLIHDYTRKQGIESTAILLPDQAPEWAHRRAELWNAAEQSETRKNSTVAREFEVALPAELSRDQRQALVHEFGRELVKRHGMAVDVAIHEPGRDGDDRNFHAHILCSTRRLTSEGFKDKTRELDDQRSGEVFHWRARWAELSNAYLERAGSAERVDHRTLEAQRQEAKEHGDVSRVATLERSPTIHLGPKIAQMEKRGIHTDRGDIARSVEKTNAVIINLSEARRHIAALKDDHERAIRSGADRTSNGFSGRPSSGRTDERGSEAGLGANIERIGRVPPPAARRRLQNLSELGVVRFAERSEVLLPRDVSRHMEHQGAQSDNSVRWRGDDLNRANSVRSVDGAKVRELVQEREGTRLPTSAANDVPAVKAEWAAERHRHLVNVYVQATRAQDRAQVQMRRQEDRIKAHDKTAPQHPSGLLAGFKQAAFEQAMATWRGVRVGLEKRLQQLKTRLGLVGEYLRQPNGRMVSKAERLAEQRAAKAKPDLARQAAQILKDEKSAGIAQRREQIQQRLTGTTQEKGMDQQTIDQVKRAADERREKSERAELKELEKAGRLAALQTQHTADQTAAQEQAKKQEQAKAQDAPEKERDENTKGARKIELLEKFKEKASRDRDDNSRGR